MPFFLLGKDAEDELRLLAPGLLATRQEALAELSRITSDPAFDDWDSEVFVVDLDSGIPVLLVRPAAEEETAEAVVPATAEEPEAAVVEELAAMTQGSAPAEFDVSASVGQITVDDAASQVADAFAVEAEAPGESEIVASSEGAGIAEGGLRDALLRTTEQMEASGISAPESVGPTGAETAVDLPHDAIVEPVVREIAEPAVEQDAAEVPVWPWDNPAEAEPPVPTPPADVAFVIDALEEPAADDASILRGSVDDEALASAKPVILGAYDEPGASGTADELPGAVEPMSVETPEEIPASLDDAGLAPFETAAPAVASGTAEPGGDDLSDFILDLETVTTVPEAPVVAEPVAEAAVDSPLSEYTCADCVYEETCPNKDQRLPKDCVSFQWK